MSRSSLTRRLVLVLVAVLSVALAAIIAATLVATAQSAERNLARELAVGERVLRSLLQQRGDQLTQAAGVLADDFGFRQAVASGDDDTIVSALINHGQRLGADLMVLFSPEGEVLISTHGLPELATISDFMPADGQPFGFLAAEGGLYQLVVVPVRAPHLIASVGMGFVVDQPLAEALRELTNADVTLLSPDDDQSRDGEERTASRVSTLQEGVIGEYDLLGTDPGGLEQWLEQQGLRGRLVRFEGSQAAQPSVLLTASYSQAAAVFRPLREQMVLVSLVMIGLATLSGLLLGRRLVQPLRSLATAAGEVARGLYDRPIPARGDDEIGELARSFRHMQTQLAEREQRISYQLLHDPLTGLPNRRRLAAVFEESAGAAGTALLLVRIRNLRELHDTLGQQAVEAILPRVAERLRYAIADDAFVGVLAEDTFAALLPAGIGPDVPALIANLEQSYREAGITYSLKFHAGTAHYIGEQPQTLDDLLRQAHIALTRADVSGAIVATYEPGEDARYLRRLAVSAALERAIAENVFELAYQPLVRLGERRLAGAEVLLRWQDASLGFVSPAEFIPLAEQSGQIRSLTRHVLARAVAQAAVWQTRGLHLPVSVNLSAADLQDESLFDFVGEQLGSNGLAPEYLSLEVTESAFIEDAERAQQNLARFRALGLHIAVDDFGTGYASLSQLKGLPVDRLKIDKSFVLQLDEDQADRDIVRSTIDLGHRLGLQVVAEGVETVAALARLERWGCDLVQGFYLSRPVSAEALLQWHRGDVLAGLWPAAEGGESEPEPGR